MFFIAFAVYNRITTICRDIATSMARINRVINALESGYGGTRVFTDEQHEMALANAQIVLQQAQDLVNELAQLDRIEGI